MCIGTTCTQFSCVLGHPVPSFYVYWDTLYLVFMFIGTPCTQFSCLLGHPLPSFHVYLDTLYPVVMLIGTPCTQFRTPCFSFHVCWDALYSIIMFVGTLCTRPVTFSSLERFWSTRLLLFLKKVRLNLFLINQSINPSD